MSNQAPGSTQKSLKGRDDERSCGELERFLKGLGEMAQISHRGQCCNHHLGFASATLRVNKESHLHFRCDKDNQECRPNRCDKASHFYFFLFFSVCVKAGKLIDKERYFFFLSKLFPKNCADKAPSSMKLKMDLIIFRLDVTHLNRSKRCGCVIKVHSALFPFPCLPLTPPGKVWMSRLSRAAGLIKCCVFLTMARLLITAPFFFSWHPFL